jgi:hypothetical protein
LDQIVGAGVSSIQKLVGKVEQIASQIHEFRSGSIALNGQTSGEVYQSTTLCD